MQETTIKEAKIRIAISLEQRSAAMQLHRDLQNRLPCSDIRLVSNIASIKSLQGASPLICVLPAIDRAGALLDETLTRNPWLVADGTTVVALLNTDDPLVINRLCESGVSDCWGTDSESLSGLAEWLSYQARMLGMSAKRPHPEQVTGSVTEPDSLTQARSEVFCQTVATVNHQINNPLSSILALIELALDRDKKMKPDELQRLKEIQRHARRIAHVTARLRELICPEVFQTPAGSMLEIEDSAEKVHEDKVRGIVSLARFRYSLTALPESLPFIQS